MSIGSWHYRFFFLFLRRYPDLCHVCQTVAVTGSSLVDGSKGLEEAKRC